MREEDREAYKQRFPMHNLTIIGNTVRLYIEHTQWYFRFDEHGGKEGAVKAAQAKRDSFPASKIHSLYDTDKVKPQGVSGVRGIIEYVRTYDKELLGYQAQWQEGEIGTKRKLRRKVFRFDKHDDPLKAAIEYREKKIAENSLSEHNAKVQPRRRRRRRVEGRSPGTNWNFLLCALATPVLIQGTEPEATPLAIYSGLTALHC